MKDQTKRYLEYIIGTELVGGLSAFLTRDGMKLYENLPKPPLTPAPIVFSIVWPALYALMGYAAARISLLSPCEERKRGLSIYYIQLAVNFAWSIIFFNMQEFGFAFFWLMLLWLLIWWMFFTFKKLDKVAGNVILPYLLWTTFAAYLNFGTWMINR